MKKIMIFLLGLPLFIGAILADFLVVIAMIVMLWGHLTSFGTWIFIGICCYLWFFGKNTEAFGGYTNRPFDALRLSTMKAFWKNWMNL